MNPRPGEKLVQRAPQLGAGLSLRHWLRNRDKPVTRGELWAFMKIYDTGRVRSDRNRRWWRRVVRWFLAPLIPKEPPSSPPSR